MANKTEHLSHLVRRLPRAIKSLDALLGSNNELIRYKATKLVIDKCIPTDAINLDQSKHDHFNVTVKIDDGNKSSLEAGRGISEYLKV